MKGSKQYLAFGVSILLILLASAVQADVDRGKTNQGIKAFQEEQWDEALKYFQDAQLDDPTDPVGHYNLAEALYKKKRFEDALKEYQKALGTEDPQLREKVYYNLGNTYFNLNKYQEAIQSYIKALDLNPDDQDAKHNLEYVRALLKEMAKKQPQQNQPNSQNQQQGQNQQKQQGKQNQDQQKQNQSPRNQQQSKQDSSLAQNQPREQEQKQKQQQEQAQPQQMKKKKALSREEAERILRALRSKEKENQKLRRMRLPAGKRQVEKDW